MVLLNYSMYKAQPTHFTCTVPNAEQGLFVIVVFINGKQHYVINSTTKKGDRSVFIAWYAAHNALYSFRDIIHSTYI